MYSSNEKARYNDLLSDYDVNDLFKVVDKEYGMQILTIVNKTDGNKTLCFSLVSDGSVITSFFTNAYKDNEDNITVEVYDLSSGNEFSFTDYVDGTRKVNYTRDEANLRTLGWWSTADECVGKFHNLTRSNIANIAIISVFDTVTLGGYTIGSIVVCAGYATASR
ncbi:hypothetical protein GCM10007049_04270 [Echinicola pacifica]|uniref:Uncharacterized protein n=1 Tax=Echinicola pacifica TaxID=346377 RepID=A0A918PLR9_9BACT|nr:hypothetical protein [Echinicola pacifica]GGZ15332.1 hypothetical protein GCM10007049_04270 [Echinicola pacifica]